MKHFLVIFLSLIFYINSFSQKPYNKNLKVNDTEFIASGILFGGGVISLGVGLLSKTGNVILQAAVRDNSENTAGNAFLIAGGASMLVGTLLYFDARAKQRKRFRLSISSVQNPMYKYGKEYFSNITSLCISILIYN